MPVSSALWLVIALCLCDSRCDFPLVPLCHSHCHCHSCPRTALARVRDESESLQASYGPDCPAVECCLVSSALELHYRRFDEGRFALPPVNPLPLLSSIRQLTGRFAEGEQHCAAEFLSALLDHSALKHHFEMRTRRVLCQCSACGLDVSEHGAMVRCETVQMIQCSASDAGSSIQAIRRWNDENLPCPRASCRLVLPLLRLFTLR